MSELAFIHKPNDPVAKAITSWIGCRPVPTDVVEQYQCLLGIRREIGDSKLPRHLDILAAVNAAIAIISEEVDERQQDAESKALMGHLATQQNQLGIGTTDLDDGC